MDPTEDPVFRPPTRGSVEIHLEDRTVSLGAPLDLTGTVTVKEGDLRRRMSVMRGLGTGRPKVDEWVVRPQEGVSDPSPYWEDFAAPRPQKNVLLTSEQPRSLTLGLAEEVRFSTPGEYAVQLQTHRIEGKVYRTNTVRVHVAPRTAAEDERARELLAKVDSMPPTEVDAVFRELMANGGPMVLETAIEKLGQTSRYQSWWTVLVHTHPDAEGALARLRALRDAPDGVFTRNHINALVAVEYNQEFEAPLMSKPTKPGAGLKRYELEQQLRVQIATKLRDKAYADLVAALSKKSAVAKGEVMGVLLDGLTHMEGKSWRAQVLAEARRGFEQVDPEVQRQYLRDQGLYEELGLQPEALIRVASGTTAAADLALVRLKPVSSDVLAQILSARLEAGVVASSELGYGVLKQAEISADAHAKLSAMLGQLNALRLFASSATASDEDRLLGHVTKGASTPILGAVAAGLITAKSARVDEVLDVFGPAHPQLLAEAAKVVGAAPELMRRAWIGVRVDDERTTKAAGDFLAEHMERADRARLERLLNNGLPPNAEVAAVAALVSAREWMLSQDEVDELVKTFRNPSSEGVIRSAQLSDGLNRRLDVGLKLGEPTLSWNWREYVGRAAMIEKFRQLDAKRKVRLAYHGAAAEHLPLYQEIAAVAGLRLIHEDRATNSPR